MLCRPIRFHVKLGSRRSWLCCGQWQTKLGTCSAIPYIPSHQMAANPSFNIDCDNQFSFAIYLCVITDVCLYGTNERFAKNISGDLEFCQICWKLDCCCISFTSKVFYKYHWQICRRNLHASLKQDYLPKYSVDVTVELTQDYLWIQMKVFYCTRTKQ